MKTLKTLACPIAVGMMFTSASGCAAATGFDHRGDATVTVRIVDADEQPIAGVHSKLFSFSSYSAPSGLTDTNGMYSVFLRKIDSQISGSFKKQGYYETGGSFWKWGEDVGLVPPADTNFPVVLKRIIDPVPMVQKIIETYLPRNDEPIGFDLEVGDWVSPYGKGKTADIQMTGTSRFESRQDFDVKVSFEFIDELCGIQSFIAPDARDWSKLRSQLMPPHIAPDNGYEQTLLLWGMSTPKPKQYQSHKMGNRNYIFRTRVVTDDNGKIIKANYGWTMGEVEIDPEYGKQIWLRFYYYYNPDPKSRSLEPKEIADRQAKDIPKEGGK